MSLRTACLETWIPVSPWISLMIYLADHMDCWLHSLRSIAAVMSLNYLNRASSDFLLLMKRDFDLLRFLIISHISYCLTLNLIASSSYESYRAAAAFTMLSLSVQVRARSVRLLPLILLLRSIFIDGLSRTFNSISISLCLCFVPTISVSPCTCWLIWCRIELASFAYSSSYASSRRYRANESCPWSLMKDSGSNTSVPGYLFASFRILLSVLSEARSFSTSNTVTRCETASSMLLTRVHDMG